MADEKYALLNCVICSKIMECAHMVLHSFSSHFIEEEDLYSSSSMKWLGRILCISLGWTTYVVTDGRGWT